MKKKVCVITGSRAEYGLLKGVMQKIKDSANMELQIIATGMHLSPEFGLTYKEIESDGFNINYKVEMLLSSDTAVSIVKAMGIGLISLSDVLETLKPQLILVLGDRFEILSAVSAALVMRIPVAHIQGGETSQGAIDESIRHAITKMSHFHFVATPKYKDRVIQLGEEPKNVFLVGGLGVDNIKSLSLLDKAELEKNLNLKFTKENLLITFHPVTLENSTEQAQIEELFFALEQQKNATLIFTLPNADAGGRKIIELIHNFVSCHSNAYVFTSLGQLRYLSLLQYIDVVIGNSSSGLLEVPSFKKPTVNIGDRQKGREKAKSVIDCDPNRISIDLAITKVFQLVQIGRLYQQTLIF